MSADSDARRIAEGSSPSQLVRAHDATKPEQDPPPFDPLRLCVFATIALLGWLAGPIALLVFAVVGFFGYLKARRAGLTKSKCYLRDTRLVLAYLGVLVCAGLWGTYALAARLGGF
ncbi:hypothetical protein [Arthrobacter cavernae]|uniref:Uncharacterized protein n=1 Tax=Arthrobacter cavernae TaxID=2817681 RepID=A0A939HED1_9MICC|nr:hypothetical protein [Arthrobacter cavernae]MBO1268311.1 hypothetical protein [Arthrobacter cavernae]